MKKLSQKEKLQLREELKVAQIQVLLKWEYTHDEIANLLKLPLTEVKIYINKYNLEDDLLNSLKEVS